MVDKLRFIIFLLVIIKAILYERTVACVRVWTLGKVLEDRSLEVTAGGLGGGRRQWRQKSVFKTFRKKNYEQKKIFSRRSWRMEIWIKQHRWYRRSTGKEIVKVAVNTGQKKKPTSSEPCRCVYACAVRALLGWLYRTYAIAVRLINVIVSQ